MKYRKTTAAVLLVTVILLAFFWNDIYKCVYLRSVYPRKYSALIDKYADENKIERDLVYAVVKNESNFNPNVESNAGAIGLMQLQPNTFHWAQSKAAAKEALNDDDLYKPEVNIKYGTIVLANLLAEFKDTRTALAAYHAGRANVKKWLADRDESKDGKTLFYIPFGDTRAYVSKVIETEKTYDNIYS